MSAPYTSFARTQVAQAADPAVQQQASIVHQRTMQLQALLDVQYLRLVESLSFQQGRRCERAGEARQDLEPPTFIAKRVFLRVAGMRAHADGQRVEHRVGIAVSECASTLLERQQRVTGRGHRDRMGPSGGSGLLVRRSRHQPFEPGCNIWVVLGKNPEQAHGEVGIADHNVCSGERVPHQVIAA